MDDYKNMSCEELYQLACKNLADKYSSPKELNKDLKDLNELEKEMARERKHLRLVKI